MYVNPFTTCGGGDGDADLLLYDGGETNEVFDCVFTGALGGNGLDGGDTVNDITSITMSTNVPWRITVCIE